ncbi:MAG: hypothetical protein WEE89_03885 [Gemmatimonadota bacterium]
MTPAGLPRGDAALRRMLEAGQNDSALIRFDDRKAKLPSDELLRLLYQGMVAYHAMQYDSSAKLLDRAGELIDERDVLWLSREAAALLSNDRALPWQPGRTERLMIPYYAALSYLRTDNVGEAAVEARRLSLALQNTEGKLEGAERRLHGMLRFFAGSVLEANGDANDAAVAYRNAQELLGDSTLLWSASADSGDVVVLVEEGFVAHKVEQSLTIVLADYEADGLRDDDEKRREEAAGAVAARALANALRPASEYAEGPRRPRQHWYVPAPTRPHNSTSQTCTQESKSSADTTSEPKSSKECKDDDDDFYLLRLAWPGYHSVRRPAHSARVLIGDSTVVAIPWFVSVSDAVVGDFERQRAKILARTVARGAAKLALTRSAEKSVGKKNEDWGKVLGTIANVGTAVLEQADTRSWTLLPGGVGLVKLRLPAGVQHMRLEVGVPSGPTSARIELGEVSVRAGETRFISARYFR